MTTVSSNSRGLSVWRHELLADAGHMLLLIAICLVFFWRLLTPFDSQRMYLNGGDFINQYYPYQQFVASELHQGRIPLWNPYIFAGHPAFADPQMAISYPIGLLLDYALGSDGLTLYDFELRSLLHNVLGAVFAYLLVKRLTGKRYAGLLAGITFGFGGYMLSYPGQQASILESAAWLPATLLFIDRGLGLKKSWQGNLCLAGATEGMAILAGHPQTAMFSFYAGAIFIVYLSNRRGLAIRQTIMASAYFGLVAAATSAIAWVPTLEFTPLSTRAYLSYDAAGPGYAFRSLLGTIIPNWRNEKALYVGMAPLLLTLVAVSRRLYSSLFWIGIAVLSTLLSLGSLTPLFAILYAKVPGFALFRNQERIALVYALAISVLAGFGIDEIIESGESARRRAIILAFPIAVVSVAALVPFVTTEWQTSTAFQAGLYGGALSGYELALMLAIVGAAILVLGPGKKGPRALVGVALVAFVVTDLFMVNWNNNIGTVPSELSPKGIATMGYIAAQPGTFRIRLENDEVLPSNYPAMFGLAHLGGDTPIRVARVERLLESANEWKLWQLFNVDYVVTRRQFGDGVELAHSEGEIKTYKVTYGLPRAYAVTSYRVAADPEEAYRLTSSPDNQPGDVVILEKDPSIAVAKPGSPRPEVEIESYSPERIELRTKGSVDAMLVVADSYYPGWKATIDGIPTGIYLADYALRAVELPKGEHTVEMVFDPQSYRVGLFISLTAWLGIFILAAKRWRRQAR